LTAKGNFKGLTAKIDAYELTGGSADVVKVGTVIINFADCESAKFTYTPNDDGLEGQTRIVRVDSGTWKYCE